MKKTKIVCTLGPACRNEETLSKMILAGMNVARLNFSHGSYEEHKKNIQMLKELRKKLGVPLPIMLDTKGPELRIKSFKDHKITLNEGDEFTFTIDEIEGDQSRVSVSYKGIVNDLQPGDTILLNNGLLVFTVTEVTDRDVKTKVVVGGDLTDKKSMFFPNKTLSLKYLSEQDINDIIFGVENGIDFIACSFTSKAQDIIDIRNLLKEHGDPDIDLIAKIESQSGVNNIDEILEVANGIMVARGDLGVEVPYEELPQIQKMLINKCRLAGKRCITATEMLESMINQPRPTRAEISDVANAVYDGTSAVMLSGETAAGKYPRAGGRGDGQDLPRDGKAPLQQVRRQGHHHPEPHRRPLALRVRAGRGHRREGDRRMLPFGRHRAQSFSLPPDHRRHRHDHRAAVVPQARPLVGRHPRAVRRVHLDGRPLLPRQARRRRERPRAEGRPHRHHGRQPQRQVGQLERHQHRADLTRVFLKDR